MAERLNSIHNCYFVFVYGSEGERRQIVSHLYLFFCIDYNNNINMLLKWLL